MAYLDHSSLSRFVTFVFGALQLIGFVLTFLQLAGNRGARLEQLQKLRRRHARQHNASSRPASRASGRRSGRASAASTSRRSSLLAVSESSARQQDGIVAIGLQLVLLSFLVGAIVRIDVLFIRALNPLGVKLMLDGELLLLYLVVILLVYYNLTLLRLAERRVLTQAAKAVPLCVAALLVVFVTVSDSILALADKNAQWPLSASAVSFAVVALFSAPSLLLVDRRALTRYLKPNEDPNAQPTPAQHAAVVRLRRLNIATAILVFILGLSQALVAFQWTFLPDRTPLAFKPASASRALADLIVVFAPLPPFLLACAVLAYAWTKVSLRHILGAFPAVWSDLAGAFGRQGPERTSLVTGTLRPPGSRSVETPLPMPAEAIRQWTTSQQSVVEKSLADSSRWSSYHATQTQQDLPLGRGPTMPFRQRPKPSDVLSQWSSAQERSVVRSAFDSEHWSRHVEANRTWEPRLPRPQYRSLSRSGWDGGPSGGSISSHGGRDGTRTTPATMVVRGSSRFDSSRRGELPMEWLEGQRRASPPRTRFMRPELSTVLRIHQTETDSEADSSGVDSPRVGTSPGSGSAAAASSRGEGSGGAVSPRSQVRAATERRRRRNKEKKRRSFLDTGLEVQLNPMVRPVGPDAQAASRRTRAQDLSTATVPPTHLSSAAMSGNGSNCH